MCSREVELEIAPAIDDTYALVAPSNICECWLLQFGWTTPELSETVKKSTTRPCWTQNFGVSALEVQIAPPDETGARDI